MIFQKALTAAIISVSVPVSISAAEGSYKNGDNWYTGNQKIIEMVEEPTYSDKNGYDVHSETYMDWVATGTITKEREGATETRLYKEVLDKSVCKLSVFGKCLNSEYIYNKYEKKVSNPNTISESQITRSIIGANIYETETISEQNLWSYGKAMLSYEYTGYTDWIEETVTYSSSKKTYSNDLSYRTLKEEKCKKSVFGRCINKDYSYYEGTRSTKILEALRLQDDYTNPRYDRFKVVSKMADSIGDLYADVRWSSENPSDDFRPSNYLYNGSTFEEDVYIYVGDYSSDGYASVEAELYNDTYCSSQNFVEKLENTQQGGYQITDDGAYCLKLKSTARDTDGGTYTYEERIPFAVNTDREKSIYTYEINNEYYQEILGEFDKSEILVDFESNKRALGLTLGFFAYVAGSVTATDVIYILGACGVVIVGGSVISNNNNNSDSWNEGQDSTDTGSINQFEIAVDQFGTSVNIPDFEYIESIFSDGNRGYIMEMSEYRRKALEEYSQATGITMEELEKMRLEVHHIVAKYDSYEAAEKARAILLDVGIDPLIGIENLVVLPYDTHRKTSLHSDAYYEKVLSDLESVPKNRASISRKLGKIGNDIRNKIYKF